MRKIKALLPYKELFIAILNSSI